MTKPPSKNPPKHLHASDLRGVAQLATQATLGVARIAEGVHQSVWSSLGVPGGKTPGKTRGVTGLVYKSVHGVTRLVGKGVDTLLARLQPALDSATDAPAGSPQRAAVLAALNGVMGDHLLETHSPFALPMTLRYQGEALNWQALPPMPNATGKVLLLIHGLCMNDLQWHTQQGGQVVDHGATLATKLGYTPVHLRYNTGLHTSQNGHALAALLEQLLAHWPTPIKEITVLAHSMGGLLIRSAFHYAQQAGLHWPGRLKNIVFLGTPHHGAPLERAGNWVDSILASTPYSAPLAKLGHLRSAGITDLRWGNVLDVDWQGHDRFQRKPDDRQPLPLPDGVACYFVAATAAAKRSALADRLIGDGLVPLHSALGQHDDPKRTLSFAKTSQWIVYRTSHMALLSSPEVTEKIVQWLTPAPSATSA
ncbi:MAG: alpha/beta hydrolase [Rhodoferax sp.]|uniref:lipase family alpha/beta hydrolase n=1 Tax=Rhodoferax sp. TaxID=50421 RepID=UPI0014013DCB|nr:alpha/beta hydrolase [Rhodoferax sp.]NDP38626.1 alpha/beta hydrolase [Rhodoferax sp.]